MAEEVKREEAGPGARSSGDSPTREAESGDVAEPDAPTAADEDESMSTILDADPLLGVQDDAGDE